ncbi:MAG: hypothetical protein K8R91_01880 [Phycisphaerae bacterium]|nr:hypothetical protein [Phycisphaerae bacterium]
MSARLSKSGKGHRIEPPIGRFSREWFMQSLRTATWVTVITILVWVYADIHFTKPQNVTAILHLHTNSDSGKVLLSEVGIPVSFIVKGNNYYRDRFITRLAEANSVLEFDVAAAKEYKPGEEYQERLANLLSKLSEFRDAGLEIVSAVPERINIRLDESVLVSGVPVRFRYTGAELEEETVKPDRIDIRIPASLMKTLDPKKLTLSTTPVDLSEKPAGKTDTVEVGVLPPPNIDYVTLIPKTVTVTFKVGQRTDSKVFTVAVGVQSPRSWLTDESGSKYELLSKPGETWTRQITVTGNPIDLENLSPEKIQAYIVLTNDDLKPVSSWLTGVVKVQFPPDLKVRLGDEPIPPVNYRMEKRTAAPPLP